MIWINAEIDYLKKSPCHTKHLWFILLFLSKHVIVLLFPSVFVICASPCVHVHLSGKFVLLHMRDFSSEGACVCACQHSSCKGMSRAKQNIWGTFHTLCHLLSCPELRPIKSALHTVCQTQLTRCPWYLQQCLWFESDAHFTNVVNVLSDFSGCTGE